MRFLSVVFLLFATPAMAGSCRYYSYGTHGATSCTGGYHEIRRRGHVESWGIRNGGFERYPGQGGPIYRTR